MQFFGKFLVCVNAGLAILFMFFGAAVYNTQVNWREATQGLQEQLDNAGAEFSSLQTEYDGYKMAQQTVVDEANQKANRLQSDLLDVTARYEALQSENDQTKIERDAQRENAVVARDEAKRRYDEAVKQRVINEKLHDSMNQLDRELTALKDELFNREVEKQELIAKHTQVLEDNATLKKVLLANRLKDDPEFYRAQTSPPPTVVGVVLDAKKPRRSGGHELIEISVGEDDGLVEGHEVYVYRTGLNDGRQAKYLGKARIVRATADKAVCEVILSAKNGEIERGDNVTTKL